MQADSDTICAQITPSGCGGVGIIRLSGPQALPIGQRLTHNPALPRQAHYGPFYDIKGEQLDMGISLYFPEPHSFTGEDVFELQGHGGQVVQDILLAQLTEMGARMARPGEFSERAFINNKLDLAQAEAISDLIQASSAQAARNAIRSLKGDFSRYINQLVEALTQLRLYLEATIDFPEEEIDLLTDSYIVNQLASIKNQLNTVLQQAKQGSLLQEGMQVVIAGQPNAGKSSLLNALAGHERAIVSNIAGTTRDLLQETIQIDGLPIHITDTAGLREAKDQIEQLGIERAKAAIEQADRLILVQDIKDKTPLAELWQQLMGNHPLPQQLTLVLNKIDLYQQKPTIEITPQATCITVSAKYQQGIDLIRQHLQNCAGYQMTSEGGFSARRRHLDALCRAQHQLARGAKQLAKQQAIELLAEDLRQAQNSLGEITGTFTSDDLLGRIFSTFCIGK